MTAIIWPISWGQHYHNFVSQEQMVSESSLGGTLCCKCHHDNPRKSVWLSPGSRTLGRVPSHLRCPLDQLPGMLRQLQWSCLYGGVRTQEENLDGAFLDNYSIALAGLWALKLTAVWNRPLKMNNNLVKMVCGEETVALSKLNFPICTYKPLLI